MTGDTERLNQAQALFIGADFAWGDPENPRTVVVLEIPAGVKVGADFRRFLDDAMQFSAAQKAA